MNSPISRRVAGYVLAILVAAGASLFYAGPAHAYRTFLQLCGGGKWTSNSQGVYIAAATVPSGWTSNINAARQQWNGISGSNFSYSAAVRVTGPLPPPGAHGVGIRLYNIHNNDGIPLSTPAWTSNVFPLSSNHSIAYVNLSNQWTWNLNGNFNQSTRLADVRTVVIHEMGHANGIAHPFQRDCEGNTRTMTAAEQASVMNPTFTQKWTTNSDDDAAMASLY